MNTTVYEMTAIAGLLSRIMSASRKQIVKDARDFYEYSAPMLPLRLMDSSAPMWLSAKEVLAKARGKEQRRSYSTRARDNSTITRAYSKKHFKVSPINESSLNVFFGSSRAYSTRAKDAHPMKEVSHPRKETAALNTSRPYSTSYYDDAMAEKKTDKCESFSPQKSSVEKSRASGQLIGEKEKPEFNMSQSEIPSSRLARIFHYGTLAAGMGLGAASQGIKLYAKGDAMSMKSLFLLPANIERMANKFSKMRGAALKIGQMMSFQDSSLLPAEIQSILLRVQNLAHYMPPGQLERVMAQDLGADWRARHFALFDDVPIAAASIGQVHTAVTKDLTPVVVKVQYPGVAASIDSDLNNLMMLLTASSILPNGLFLDKTIANARTELKWECDYIREAQNLIRFRDLMADETDVFTVPRVFHHLCGTRVLTMERMRGVEIVKGTWDQDTRNYIATQIMRLCLKELKEFHFMQTDPNWANFLYNEQTGCIELLDFGAAREFSDVFIRDYVQVLRAAIRKDREQVKQYLLKLRYLTGLESQLMVTAHVDSVMVLGEAFSPLDNHGRAFDFSRQTITDRVKDNMGVMLSERLTPPPEETYSLHRKLSGVFLLCARLNATVPCEELFREIIGYE